LLQPPLGKINFNENRKIYIRMKIAIDARELKQKQVTGICRILKLFLDSISDVDRKYIYLLADNKTDTSSYSDIFHIIKMKAPFTFWYDQVTIPKILKNENIDVFFSPYYKMPFLSKCKKIITICDLHFFKPLLWKGSSRIKPFKTYLRMALKQADKIITISKFSKTEILRQFDISEQKIKVIYLGVDKKFKPLNKEQTYKLRDTYGINFKYILYIGNMKPHKNVEGLIKAYSPLSDEIKETYKLIIIAKKDENFIPLNKIVRKSNLQNNVIFLDFVPDDDLLLFYNFAELFVFPSYYEGFGLPPLEAMSCGTPVISSYTTSLREVLGESALFFNPYDIKEISRRISDVLNNNELKETLRSKGISHAKKYDNIVFSNDLLEEIKGI